jgi:hypothetical protein
MISQIKGFDGKPKFSELANLMLGILVIPHMRKLDFNLISAIVVYRYVTLKTCQ